LAIQDAASWLPRQSVLTAHPKLISRRALFLEGGQNLTFYPAADRTGSRQQLKSFLRCGAGSSWTTVIAADRPEARPGMNAGLAAVFVETFRN
jgi:hypothetical protein